MGVGRWVGGTRGWPGGWDTQGGGGGPVGVTHKGGGARWVGVAGVRPGQRNGTERNGTGRAEGAAMSFCSFFGGEVFKDHFQPGIYVCAKCGHELFSSRAKYEHSSPWPAFTETLRGDSVAKREERPGALKVTCGKCGNGLGHEFLNDGPKRGQSRF
uniref:Methionine sulfoxide reductase B1 n=1 Tax=Taeniopygia guttata TaxID=59729 RepID=A0A674GPM4_TAEGU